MKKLLALTLSLLLLCSCGEDSSPEQQGLTQADNDEFGISFFPEDNINPLTTKSKENLELFNLVYEGLFELDEKFNPTPLLCEKYSENINEYTFTLKKGLYFSDGSPLTASDVVHSITLAQEDASYFATRLSNIVSVTSRGNNIIITLYNPNAKLASLLDVPIIKKGSEKQKIAIGTGPYHLSYDKKTKEYSLLKNPHWHGTDTLPYDNIKVVCASGVDDLVWSFESMEVDFITMDPTGSNPYQFRGDYQYTDMATTSLVHLGFNHNSKIFQSAALRRAVSCAIDRKSAIEQDFALMGSPTSLPIHPSCDAYSEEISKTIDYSKENATALFFDAGLTDADGDGKFDETNDLTILVNSENVSRVALAKRIATSLTTLGLPVTVREAPWETYLQSLRDGDFDMYIAEVNLRADFNLDSLIRSDSILNYGGYSSEATNNQLLIYNALPLSQGEQMTSFLNHFADTCPIVPILFKKHSAVTHKNFFAGLTPTSHNVYYKFNSWKVVE